MRITELLLKNFRNYADLNFKPVSYVNILVGNNAQGKTNLLEAIYFLLKGKSFRTAHERDTINFQSSGAELKARIKAYSQEFVVTINLGYNKPKNLKINNINSNSKKLKSNFGVILFTPDHLSIIKGSPQERRNFLDYELSGFYPQYNYYLSNYQKVLMQRNSFLKEIKEKRQSPDNLYLWDEQLFEYGSKIITARFEILKKLIPVAQKIHNQITLSKEQLKIRYLSSLNLNKNLQPELIYKEFKTVSRSIRNQELYRAQTLVGPHRDDLGFFIADKSIIEFGSQGQQRTIILTLKLALIDLWKEELNEVPIILLDDVFFELDQYRQRYFFDLIKRNVQVFITTTGIDNMGKYGYNNNGMFLVRNGFVLPLGI